MQRRYFHHSTQTKVVAGLGWLHRVRGKSLHFFMHGKQFHRVQEWACVCRGGFISSVCVMLYHHGAEIWSRKPKRPLGCRSVSERWMNERRGRRGHVLITVKYARENNWEDVKVGGSGNFQLKIRSGTAVFTGSVCSHATFNTMLTCVY